MSHKGHEDGPEHHGFEETQRDLDGYVSDIVLLVGRNHAYRQRLGRMMHGNCIRFDVEICPSVIKEFGLQNCKVESQRKNIIF